MRLDFMEDNASPCHEVPSKLSGFVLVDDVVVIT